MGIRKKVLKDLQPDHLKDVVNNSFALASTIVSDMLNTKVSFKSPSIHAYPMLAMKDLLEDRIGTKKEFLLIRQLFQSTVNGDAYFILRKEDAKKITSMLLKKNRVDSYVVECISVELANILISAYIRSITKTVNSKTILQPPQVIKESRLLETGFDRAKPSSNFLLIGTKLDFGHQMLSNAMFILIGEEVSSALFNRMSSNA